MKDLVTTIIGFVASALCLSASLRQFYIGDLVMGFAFAMLCLTVALQTLWMARRRSNDHE